MCVCVCKSSESESPVYVLALALAVTVGICGHAVLSLGDDCCSSTLGGGAGFSVEALHSGSSLVLATVVPARHSLAVLSLPHSTGHLLGQGG